MPSLIKVVGKDFSKRYPNLKEVRKAKNLLNEYTKSNDFQVVFSIVGNESKVITEEEIVSTVETISAVQLYRYGSTEFIYKELDKIKTGLEFEYSGYYPSYDPTLQKDVRKQYLKKELISLKDACDKVQNWIASEKIMDWYLTNDSKTLVILQDRP